MKEIAFKAIRKPLNRNVLSTTKGLQLANQISFERSFRWKQVYLVPSSNIIKFSHECQNYTKKTSLRLPVEVALANAFDAREPNPSLINYKLSRAKEKAELPLKCIKVVPDA